MALLPQAPWPGTGVTKAASPCSVSNFQTVYSCAEPSVLRLHVAHLGGAVSEGSGFVMAADATGLYVITNEHVVLGATAKTLTALAPDGKTSYPVQSILSHTGLTGTLNDLAVVKLAPANLQPLTWGNSDSLQVGQPVASIGYGDPFDLAGPPSFTQGAISQLQRDLGRCHGGRGWIQHQTPINHGNSGGPLLDVHGNVVGVNTLSFDQTDVCGTGRPAQVAHELFFAIPANLARATAEQLMGSLKHGTTQRAVPPPSTLAQKTRYFTFQAPKTWKISSEPRAITPSAGGGFVFTIQGMGPPQSVTPPDNQVYVELRDFPVDQRQAGGGYLGLFRFLQLQIAQQYGTVAQTKTTSYALHGMTVVQTSIVFRNRSEQLDYIDAATATYGIDLQRWIHTNATPIDIQQSNALINSLAPLR